MMEMSLIEMKSQLRELQYGKGGLNSLSSSLNDQMERFEQL